jgi:hypothetical protein
MSAPVPGPIVRRLPAPTRGRLAALGTASPQRSREDSRRGRVWRTPAAMGRSPPVAVAVPDSGEPLRRRPEPRMRRATPRPRRESHEDGAPRSEPRCRSPAPRQSGLARKGDAAGSSRRSRREALATLATPRLQHLATSGRRHAYAKPVGFAPVALLGLVRPLDSRLSETWITSGARRAPLSPTGLRREYTKGWAAHPRPEGSPSAPPCVSEGLSLLVRSRRL